MFWTRIKQLIKTLRKEAIKDQNASKKSYAQRLKYASDEKDAATCLIYCQTINSKGYICDNTLNEIYHDFKDLNKSQEPFKLSDMYVYEDVETVGKNNLE